MPEELRELLRANQRDRYGLLMKAAGQAFAAILTLIPACVGMEPPSLTWDSYMGTTSNPDGHYTLSYTSVGDGQPILLIHGFGATSYSWRHVVPALSAKYRVLAVDLKGSGKSPKPQDERYSLYDHADEVYNFIHEHHLTDLHIVGHSLGGGIALLIALKLQERGEKLASLVLLDTIAYPQAIPAFISLLRTPVAGWLSTNVLPAKFQVRSILNVAYYDDSKVPEDAVTAYAEPLSEPNGTYALLQTAQNLIPDDLDQVTKRYASLTAPVLIIWGKEDEIVPLSIGEKLARELPNAVLRVIKETGHIPHEENPEAAIPLITEFVSTLADR